MVGKSIFPLLIFFFKGSSYFCKTHQIDDKDIDRHDKKVELFGRYVYRCIWCKYNSISKKKKIMPTIKHGGGSVTVWGCLLLQDLDDSLWLMAAQFRLFTRKSWGRKFVHQFLTSSCHAFGFCITTLIKKNASASQLLNSFKKKSKVLILIEMLWFNL